MTNEQRSVRDWMAAETVLLDLTNTAEKAIIDKEDEARVLEYSAKWYMHPTKHVSYTNRRYIPRTTMLHILIMKFPKKLVIHHRDSNPLNNSKSNLMITTTAINGILKPKIRGRSKYKGVYWKNDRNKWQVLVQRSDLLIHGGHFINEDDAGKKAAEIYAEIDKNIL